MVSLVKKAATLYIRCQEELLISSTETARYLCPVANLLAAAKVVFNFFLGTAAKPRFERAGRLQTSPQAVCLRPIPLPFHVLPLPGFALLTAATTGAGDERRTMPSGGLPSRRRLDDCTAGQDAAAVLPAAAAAATA